MLDLLETKYRVEFTHAAVFIYGFCARLLIKMQIPTSHCKFLSREKGYIERRQTRAHTLLDRQCIPSLGLVSTNLKKILFQFKWYLNILTKNSFFMIITQLKTPPQIIQIPLIRINDCFLNSLRTLQLIKCTIRDIHSNLHLFAMVTLTTQYQI